MVEASRAVISQDDVDTDGVARPTRKLGLASGNIKKGRRTAEAWLAKAERQSGVTVYVCQEHPENSVLEPGGHAG